MMIKSISISPTTLLIRRPTPMPAASAYSKRIKKDIILIMPLQLLTRKRKAWIGSGWWPVLWKMKPESTITRFKNLTPSNLEELDSESKISSAIKLWWVKLSSITKSSRKLRKSPASRIWRNAPRTTFSAEFVGVLRKTKPIHWLLPASAKVQSVSSTSSA